MNAAVCWNCGATLQDVPVPFSRLAECLACHAELHVCRMCRHFDPGKAKQCREPMAEEVKDKGRANFCEWFQAGPNPSAQDKPPADTGREALGDLFGGSAPTQPNTPDGAREALKDLFGG